MRASIILAWLIAEALMPSAAFAWGDIGHRVICQIAYKELKPEIKARVDALVAIDLKFRTYADGSGRMCFRVKDRPSITSICHALLKASRFRIRVRLPIDASYRRY